MRDRFAEIADQIVGLVIRIQAIQEKQVGLRGDDTFRSRVGVRSIADHAEIPALAEQAHQRLAEQSIFGYNINVRRWDDCFSLICVIQSPQSSLQMNCGVFSVGLNPLKMT